MHCGFISFLFWYKKRYFVLWSNKFWKKKIYINIVLNVLIKWFAPILSFTTEEIYKLLKKNQKSIHLEKFLEIPNKFKNEKINEKWEELVKIRNICNVSLEEKRAIKEIGSSLEADLKIQINKKMKLITDNVDFSELCITSKAKVEYKDDIETMATAIKAKGTKCPVCWKINEASCPRHS